MSRRSSARARPRCGGASVVPTSVLYARALAAVNATTDLGGVTQLPVVLSGDSYEVDGVSGKVSTLVDLLDGTHKPAQATSATQVAVPSASSALRGSLAFTFAGAQYYVSNRAANLFRFLQNPVWAVAVIVPSATGERVVFSTIQPAATTQLGAYFARVSTEIKWRGYNGSGIAMAGGGAVTQANGTAYCMSVDYSEGSSPEHRTRQNGASVATSNSGGAPSTSDPQSTLYVGAYNTGASPLQGDLGWLSISPKRPSAADYQNLSAYLYRKYGVRL